MQNIFGERQSHGDCLYACKSAEEYDQKVANLKEKWNEIEREHTRNNPPNKFVSYFVAHKEKQIREKTIKAVRRKANIDGDYDSSFYQSKKLMNLAKQKDIVIVISASLMPWQHLKTGIFVSTIMS